MTDFMDSNNNYKLKEQIYMNTNDTPVQETSRKDSDRCNCPTCMGRAGTVRVCFNSRKLASRKVGNALAKTVGLLLLAGVLLQGQARAGVTVQNAGAMDQGESDKISTGYLRVFSSTEETQWGEGPYYYVHTGYRIYDSAGRAVKWVANHDSSTDEAPEKVELAPGQYTIWALSDTNGYVKVPVVIKLARTTAVHLET